jgi:hypothetical protein
MAQTATIDASPSLRGKGKACDISWAAKGSLQLTCNFRREREVVVLPEAITTEMLAIWQDRHARCRVAVRRFDDTLIYICWSPSDDDDREHFWVCVARDRGFGEVKILEIRASETSARQTLRDLGIKPEF